MVLRLRSLKKPVLRLTTAFGLDWQQEPPPDSMQHYPILQQQRRLVQHPEAFPEFGASLHLPPQSTVTVSLLPPLPLPWLPQLCSNASCVSWSPVFASHFVILGL